MTESDRHVRIRTYALFVEFGRAPTLEEVARDIGVPAAEVEQCWRRLHDAHALVLDRGSARILMAHPFSAAPTIHRVHARGRWWYANCAWDSFGILAALGVDGRIVATCPDCGEEIAFDVHDGAPDDETPVFHCPVPAAQWWNDIVDT